MAAVPLAEVTRGPLVERVHRGHLVVMDRRFKVVAALGEPSIVAYMRSCAKPIQLLPLVFSGAADHFGFNDTELAVMCASHYGEPVHLEVLQRIMYKADLNWGQLDCGAAPSIRYDYALDQARRGVALTPLHNDCSGKHLGMLALCRYLGLPLEGYIRPDHPVQQRILHTFAKFCGLDPDTITLGMDGCSVPVYALPLERMARGYVNLMRSDPAEEMSAAAARVTAAMTANSQMIAGSGGFCTALIRAGGGDLIGKIGADGVYCAASRRAGLALAVKVEDGDMAALPTVVVRVLDDLGLTPEGLDAFRAPEICNDAGRVTGVRRACFRLKLKS